MISGRSAAPSNPLAMPVMERPQRHLAVTNGLPTRACVHGDQRRCTRARECHTREVARVSRRVQFQNAVFYLNIHAT